ncbi:MAG: MOSC domain-containing protein [Myxococcales bacterium]
MAYSEDSPLVQQLMLQRAQPGRLRWIGLRESHRGSMHVVESAELLTQRGLVGDRAAERSGGKRQVTLIQAEHLPTIAALCGRSTVDPLLLRRNLVIEGFSVLSLRARRFRLGGALLEGTGTCDPCSRMEEVLGTGGYNATRGHGGITARVLEGGPIRIGDVLDFAFE